MTVSHTSVGDSQNAVIFLHGVGSGKEGWARQQDATVEAGWKFIAIDAPGYGQTPLPDAPGFGPHIDAVLEVIDIENPNKVVLCGHSLGGMTVQEIYAKHPSIVSGLILSATSPAFGRPDGDFQKQFIQSRLEPFGNGMTMPDFARSFAAKLLGPNPTNEATEDVIAGMSKVSIDAYRLSMHTIVSFDQRANLAHIEVPTLAIAGSHDSNSPAKMMSRMAEHIEGCEFVELQNTGHMAPLENSEEFNNHLSLFLKRLA